MPKPVRTLILIVAALVALPVFSALPVFISLPAFTAVNLPNQAQTLTVSVKNAWPYQGKMEAAQVNGNGWNSVADLNSVIDLVIPKRLIAKGAKQNGLSYAEYRSEAYKPEAIEPMLVEAAATGANWITFVVTQYQYSVDSTLIYPTVKTATNGDLILAIERAQAVGLKVALKPHIDVESDDTWRGNIGQTFSEADWAEWFVNYTAFMRHYAQIAQSTNAELLVIGTEYRDASHRESEWRAVASSVRQLYDGPLSYSANHSDEEVAIMWWDALDFIGVSAYYPLDITGEATVEALESAWQPHITRLASLASQWSKQIIFTEIGYRSIENSNSQPWCHTCGTSLDIQIQERAYDAFYNAVYDQPWLAGMHWWGWAVEPAQSGPCNSDYSPYNKLAENVMRLKYGQPARALTSECGSNPPVGTAIAPTATPPPVLPALGNADSGFMLVENFEQSALGLVTRQEGWHGLGRTIVTSEPAALNSGGGSSNQLLSLSGENALAYHLLPVAIASRPADNSATSSGSTGIGTLHYRVARIDAVDASSGGSDEAAPTQFSGFEAQLAVQYTEPETFKARDGADFASLNGTFVTAAWNCVWIHADLEAQTYMVYIQGDDDTEPVLLDDTTGQGGFSFRNGDVTELRTFYIRTGWDGGGQVLIDDIYVDPTEHNLTSPIDSCGADSVATTPTPVVTEVSMPTVEPTATSSPTATPMLSITPSSTPQPDSPTAVASATPTATATTSPTASQPTSSTPVADTTPAPDAPTPTEPNSAETPTSSGQQGHSLFVPLLQ